MSGILAVIGSVRDSRVAAALSPLRYLGGDREQVWSEEDALIVVTRKAWQLDDDFSGNVLVLETPDLIVAADASLFDKKGLARKLSTAGVRAHGETASHYLEAAYRAWGPEMVHQLNGDYAFVIWDRRERKLFAARDPIGGRPLYWTRIGSGIAVASSCRALAELRGTTQALNLVNLGAQVAGLAWSNGVDTAYEGVETLLPGRWATWLDGKVELEIWWHPRKAPAQRPSPMAEAAEELRDLLSTAVSQRLSSGVTSIWMSGGWDSTAVFGAGQHALAAEGRSRLRPVSISYPEGDPGHEDELIRQVAGRWDADVHWIQSEELQLFAGLEERAARYDEPPRHLYELWNRGLAKGSRAVGCRIALDGAGGDHLFQVSDIILADLFRTARWADLIGVIRSRRARGWKHLVGLGVLPLLPDRLVQIAERVLNRRIPRHYLERSFAEWVRPGFISSNRLRERDLSALHSVGGSGPAQSENILYLKLPVWSWGGGFMRGALLQEGVEVRSPLLDPRVIDFALGRPIHERYDGRETKILLRLAMSGLLPREILAPRASRTGVTVGLSRQQMREAYPNLVNRIFAEPLRIADLGMIDPARLRSAAERYLAGDRDEFLRVNLFHAIRVELWLRGLERRAQSPSPMVDSGLVDIEIPAA